VSPSRLWLQRGGGADSPRALRQKASKDADVPWLLVAEASFCPTFRKRLAGADPDGGTSVSACQALAAADSGCGDVMYSNGATDCYCLQSGHECELKASMRGNSVYQQVAQAQTDEADDPAPDLPGQRAWQKDQLGS